MSPLPNDTIPAAHRLLARKLADITPAKLPMQPEPYDFDALNEYVLAMARAFDQWMIEVGRAVQANASCRVDLDQFNNMMLDQCEGFACFEIQKAGDALREERAA